MINTLSLVNICHHGYKFLSLMRTFKVYSLSNFQICSTELLTVVSMLYITSPGLIYFTAEVCAYWPPSSHSFSNQTQLRQINHNSKPFAAFLAKKWNWIILLLKVVSLTNRLRRKWHNISLMWPESLHKEMKSQRNSLECCMLGLGEVHSWRGIWSVKKHEVIAGNGET